MCDQFVVLVLYVFSSVTCDPIHATTFQNNGRLQTKCYHELIKLTEKIKHFGIHACMCQRFASFLCDENDVGVRIEDDVSEASLSL